MIRRFIFFSAFLILISSCEKQQPITIISGVLPNSPNEELTLIPVKQLFPGLESIGNHLKTKTDSLGNFKFRVDSLQSGFYQITTINYPRLKGDLFLEPGDSIYVKTPEYNSEDSFNITGINSKKLQYLVSDAKIFPKSSEFYKKIRSSDFETEMHFKAYIDSIHDARRKGTDTMYFKSEALKTHHLQTINAERAEFLLAHLERRNYRMNGNFEYYYPEEDYLAFLSDLNFTATVSNNSAIKKLAGTYLTHMVEEELKNADKEKKWSLKFGERFRYVLNQTPSPWNDQLMLSIVGEYSMAMLQEDFFSILKDYNESMMSQFTVAVSKDLFSNNVTIYNDLAPGMFAPNFELPDANGNLHRLSDLKGKIVYIDFWGTWCGPCIQEIPAALALQEKYANDNIEFLYVALEYDENDIERWKKFISGESNRSKKLFKDSGFPGLHLVADKQFNNEALKPYSLNFAPTHVLIDEDGKIIDARADGAARVGQQLDDLVNKKAVLNNP